MSKSRLTNIWKKSLPLVFILILVHFLKDLTQDILKIATPLDLLGDAKEDLSQLPQPLQKVYLYGLGGLSIIAEVFLLVAIPKVWKVKEYSRLDKLIFILIVFLIVFFVTTIVLDPRYL